MQQIIANKFQLTEPSSHWIPSMASSSSSWWLFICVDYLVDQFTALLWFILLYIVLTLVDFSSINRFKWIHYVFISGSLWIFLQSYAQRHKLQVAISRGDVVQSGVTLRMRARPKKQPAICWWQNVQRQVGQVQTVRIPMGRMGWRALTWILSFLFRNVDAFHE